MGTNIEEPLLLHRNRGVRLAFIVGTKIEEWYDNIYCHPYCMVLCTVFEERACTDFEEGTTHFLRQFFVFCWHKNRGRTTSLNAISTVQIVMVLAQFSRADFC